MASLLTNEFYEHLYKLEEKGTGINSWTSKVTEENEDLQWCRNFLEETLWEADKNKLKRNINWCFEHSFNSKLAIAKHLHITTKKLMEYIKEFKLEDYFNHQYYFWHGIILQHCDTQETFFVRSPKAGGKFIGAKHSSNITNAISNNQTVSGYFAIPVCDWKKSNPNFELNREEILNEEVIRVA